jgi:hypothetical protein
MKKLFWIGFLLLLTRCDRIDTQLLMVNNTDNIIYYYILPDTNLYVGKNISNFNIHPHDSIRPRILIGGNGVWTYWINHESKDSTLHIFIFSKNIITNQIIKEKDFRRLDYKVKDLNNLNWNVTIKP